MAVASYYMRDMGYGLNDYEFAFGPLQDKRNDNGANSGTIFNTSSGYVDVTKISDLYSAESEVTDRQQLLQHGDVPGIRKATSKTVTLEVEIRQADRTDSIFRTEVTNIEKLFSLDESYTEQQLNWKLPGQNERFIRCRVLKRRRTIDVESELGVARLEILLQAADPRMYDAAVNSQTILSGTSAVVVNSASDRVYPECAFDTGVGNNRAYLYNVTHTDSGTIDIVNGGFGTDSLGYANMDRLVRAQTEDIILDHTFTEQYGNWRPASGGRKPLFMRPGSNSMNLVWGQEVSIYWHNTYL